ncbi:MAG: C39 family peptidase [Synechococcus sp. ELA057]
MTSERMIAQAADLIASFEGFRGQAYPDPASGGDPWTIGYGVTTLNGRPVMAGETISQAEARRLLLQGVRDCAGHLATRIPHWGEMSPEQHCALLSFAWNLGRNFYGDGEDFATISRALRNRDWQAVPQALCLYINPGSRVSAGLLKRRQAEGVLWNQGLRQATHSQATSGASSPAKRLKVPWFDQLAIDRAEGPRLCFSASAAMLAATWGKVTTAQAYNRLRQAHGDSTSAEAQLATLRQLGLVAEFRMDGTTQDLQREIDAGRPVAVGWLHHGPSNAPSGDGHWSVVIGTDASGVIMHDPYGDCDLVNGGHPSHHNGAGLHYSYRNWLPRWQPQGSGGWMLLCRG